MKKIFLIDGHAQIFRMYYAFMRRPMVNSKGVDTSILFGFTKMLLELVAKEQPTHLAVAFDPPAKTFRHEAYPEYKANRSAAPELVKQALEPLQEILAAFGIPVVMIPGYEADDVIGSMASQWESQQSRIFMVTPDKDYGQLVTDNIFQYKPAKGGNELEVLGKEQICANYGVCSPEQVIDILTIWGDASDNVPGVKGIGEVGAKKLVGKYGSISGIQSHLDELPPKQRDSFIQAGEQLEMSRFLITIKKDIELPLGVDDIVLAPFNYQEILKIFNKYEFNSLRKLLPVPLEELRQMEASSSKEDGQERSGTVQQIKYNYEDTSLDELLPVVEREGMVSVAITSSGMLLISAYKNGVGAHDGKLLTSVAGNIEEIFGREDDALSANLKRILEDKNIFKVGYGFKECIKKLKRCGVDLNSHSLKGLLENVGDLSIMHYLINPERSHKEDMLIRSYLSTDIDAECEEASGDGPVDGFEPDLFSVTAEEPVVEPQTRDKRVCALMLPLYEKVLQALEDAGQKELYLKLEMPLIGVLGSMECEGVKIDTAHLKEYSKQLTSQMNAIESQVREMAGDDSVNLSSPKQIGVLLYEKLKLNPKVKKSSKGNYPTDEETLNELSGLHPIISLILDYRALKKLLSTYIDNLPELIDKVTGKIHTTFNQTITATGRLSSTNPNLQNIPIRSERGKEIRKAFVPSDPDGSIVSADYSQIELRLMAHMSGDRDLIDAFNRGMDIHTATAAKVFGVPEEEVSREQRSRAKVANFGIIYGISAFGLSQRLGMGRADSKALIEEYFRNYPNVRKYMYDMIAKAREAGYVETICHRRRYLPDINSRNAAVRGFNERNAINAPLQGSAADIIKIAMINVHKRLKTDNFASRMVLQVHDELVFDVVPGEEERLEKMVKEEMESVFELSVPLIVECNGGKNWLEAH